MRPLRVLVVDDNHLIRWLLALILEDAGHLAVLAEDGATALDLARQDPPDVWIVDEVMPGMAGSELIATLRRSQDPRLAGAPVIGLSGRTDGAKALLGAGADEFVPKPVEDVPVLEAIERATGWRRRAADEDQPAA